MQRGSRTVAALASATLTAGLALAACGATPAHRVAAPVQAPVAVQPSPVTLPMTFHRPAVDPHRSRANELGAVPVLMYHQLQAHPTHPFDETPQQFRQELTGLFAHGFRTTTAAALVSGTIDLPAGAKAMVLTFDDSSPSQMAVLPNGRIDPRCSVGILLDVARHFHVAHPVATFYVNSSSFRGHPTLLGQLASMGMEIADHTFSHADLHDLSDDGVQRELATDITYIHAAAPQAQVTTMALPYGYHPKNGGLASHGSWRGTAYSFQGVLLVGSNPAPSPFDARFQRLALPRIRSGAPIGSPVYTSPWWIARLENGTVAPWVSDGDPDAISFPRRLAPRLAHRFAALALPY